MKTLRSRLITFLCFAFVGSGYAGQYFQDFSGFSAGTTSFGDGSTLFSDQLGTVAAVQDNTYRELALTASGTGNTHSAFLLPDLDSGAPVYAFSVKWNSQVYGNFPDVADGFSFNFGQLASLNLSSAAYEQESGYGTGISFDVQTYPDNNPGFYIRVNANIVASVTNNPNTQWLTNNGTRHFFEVDWNYFTGMTVKVDHQTIFKDVATTGFLPASGDRMVWAARCGAFTEEVRLDNIMAVTGGNLVQATVMSPFSDANQSPTQPAANAFDGSDDTYWATLASHGYIGANIPAGIIRAYALTSAESHNGNVDDPLTWMLQGSDDGNTWTDLGSNNNGDYFMNREETRCWPVTNSISSSACRLNIAANFSGASPTALGELRVYVFQPASQYALPWTNGISPGSTYGRVVASSDLNVIATAPAWNYSGYIYCSTNRGKNWFIGDQPNEHWSCVAMSADGSKIVAGSSYLDYPTGVAGYLYLSTNSGVNWMQLTNAYAYWNALAMSADGKTIIGAGEFSDLVYISTNSGATFTATSLPARYWQTVACSSDASKIIVAQEYWIYGGAPQYDYVYVSTNSGATWTQTSLPYLNWTWQKVASSADGRIFAAAGYYSVLDGTTSNGVFISYDSGTTWRHAQLPDGFWSGITMSADGSKLTACENYFSSEPYFGIGQLSMSSDYGVDWQTVPKETSSWQDTTASADGSHFVAVSANGVIAYSYFPLLTITAANGNSAISWTTNQIGFGLQETTNLASGIWTDTPTNGMNTVGEIYQLTTTNGVGNKFYRLKAN